MQTLWHLSTRGAQWGFTAQEVGKSALGLGHQSLWAACKILLPLRCWDERIYWSRLGLIAKKDIFSKNFHLGALKPLYKGRKGAVTIIGHYCFYHLSTWTIILDYQKIVVEIIVIYLKYSKIFQAKYQERTSPFATAPYHLCSQSVVKRCHETKSSWKLQWMCHHGQQTGSIQTFFGLVKQIYLIFNW